MAKKNVRTTCKVMRLTKLGVMCMLVIKIKEIIHNTVMDKSLEYSFRRVIKIKVSIKR